jgi:hypothetical protein
MTNKPTLLHSQSTAESIAREYLEQSQDWRYAAIQWGPVFWVVEISDEHGLIGYL